MFRETSYIHDDPLSVVGIEEDFVVKQIVSVVCFGAVVLSVQAADRESCTVEICREAATVQEVRQMPVEWAFMGADSIRFRVPEPVAYEVVLTSMTGKVLSSKSGIAQEGWQTCAIPPAVASQVCILRIKIGCQLVVAGKMMWPAGKV